MVKLSSTGVDSFVHNECKRNYYFSYLIPWQLRNRFLLIVCFDEASWKIRDNWTLKRYQKMHKTFSIAESVPFSIFHDWDCRERLSWEIVEQLLSTSCVVLVSRYRTLVITVTTNPSTCLLICDERTANRSLVNFVLPIMPRRGNLFEAIASFPLCCSIIFRLFIISIIFVLMGAVR